MSNPYDPGNPGGNPDPHKDNPYGAPSYPTGPSGGSPYGAPQGGSPYGTPQGGYGGGGYGTPYGQSGAYGDSMPKKTDAVSIVGFILSLTCCLSVVGAILGLIGLKRTSGGKRKGRWAAVTATVVGILGTLAAVLGTVAIVNFANSVITVDEAEVGQCANISSEDNDSVVLTDKDCSDDHDAEIVWTGTVGDAESSDVAPSNPDDFTDAGASFLICTSLMDPADVEALGEDVDYQYVVDGQDAASGDAALCYAERSDGEKFTSKQLP